MSTFDEEMRAALAAGEPLLDNVTDPDRLVSHGLEAPGGCTCDVLPGEHTEDQCAAELWKQRGAR